MPFLDRPITNFVDSDGVDLGKKLVTKDYLLSVYETILESSGATGLVVTPELWGWGIINAGRLGEGTTGNSQRDTPITTFAGGTNWKQVMMDDGSSGAAIKTDGTLWIWGWNNSGEIGVNDNTQTVRATPVTTFAGGNDWKQVAGGFFFTAAIKTDGSLWTWGYGIYGKLGNNADTNRSTPVTTFAGGNDWKQVSGGTNHTAAIKTDGSLWIWGGNYNTSNLGINLGNNVNRSTPVTTFAGGNDWKSVSCGRNHTAAIKTDGTLWVWGGNAYGKLGTNDTNTRSTPVTTFAGGNDWKQVACGGFHIAAIKTDGSLWTWGRGTSGQLGNNANTDRNTPVTTFAGGNNWKQVSCADNHTAAIKTDGSLWNWGANNGRNLGLGNNDSTHRSTPVTTFAGGNNWKQVASAGGSTMAIKSIDYI